MIKETTTRTTRGLLALIAISSAFAGCGEATGPSSELEVAGQSAELRDGDNDGHDDYDDSWRCPDYGKDKHNRNKCPAVAAIAQPPAIKVGQTTKLKGFAVDIDGPRQLKFSWSVSPANIGSIANSTSKRTTFKCLAAGKAIIKFTATDGDCARSTTVTVECQGTTAPKCGDGAKNGNETCDNSSSNPADRCPTSCDDQQACTKDTLTGSAASCTAQCTHTAITTCANGDGCCAPGCTSANDDSCKPTSTCGNGIVEGSEKCDGNCPTSCDDKNACTTDVLTGKASTCDAVCTNTPITTCSAGTADTCCAPGCNANTDVDCVSTCGNGVVETSGGETCDPLSSCPTTCDDKNACTKDTLVGDPTKCTAACTSTPITACVSGDGCCAAGCKNPANGGNDSDCPPAPTCGDGILQASETCDNSTSTKCPTSCADTDPCTTDVLSGTASTCDVKCSHSAITQCTSGATGDQCCPANCNATNDGDCVPKCGNGVIESPELCDGTCPMSAADCDDKDACTTDAFVAGTDTCHNTCTHTPITTGACVCGNGKLDSGETCDGQTQCQALLDSCDDKNACTTDGHTGDVTSCNIVCTHTPITTPACLCGNGTLDSGETCDGTTGPNACPTSCPAGTDACNPVALTGDAASCTAKCVAQPVNVCKTGDGCCPTAVTCTNAQDGECGAPPDPCATCQSSSCGANSPASRCDGLTGVTAAGPMAGVSKATLCHQILDCFQTSHCGANFNDSDCYCGTNADGSSVDANACFSGAAAATGPCKALVEAGAESTAVGDIAQRYSTATYAVGAALTVLEGCDYLSCNLCL